MSDASHAARTRWWQFPRQYWNAILNDSEEQVFLVLTLLIGALTSLMAVAFILLTERFGARLYPAGGAMWHRLVFPIVGSLSMGYLLFRYFPEARGSGLVQTKAALYAREGRITARTMIGKFFCTSATLASGIPLGPEGPTVHVGAAIASVLGRNLGLRPEKVKALIPVAASAAIAAAFNTPLAAVLFALEEVVGELHAPVLGSVVLASATSWAVLRLLLGNNPLFKVPQYELVNYWEFAIYAVLGVIGGFVSVAFCKTLLALRERWFMKLPRKTVWFQPVAGGIVVGLIGMFVPQVLGVGYNHVGEVLNGGMAFHLMAWLLLLKLVTVAASYASGNAGGIFGPSLCIGAMLGGTVGYIGHHFLPGYVATPGAYALVGMGTVFAGIVRTPMTSIVMIFETTLDYAVVGPLMISNLISFFISRRFQKESLFEALARQDGLHLPSPGTRELEGLRQVILAMRPATEVLQASMTAQEALDKIRSSECTSWPVMDGGGLMGVLTFGKIQSAAAETQPPKLLGELVDATEFPHVHADHSLSIALERMGAAQLNAIPVVSRANIHKIEGIVTLKDVLSLYGLEATEKA
ncbi:MAG TPA: chloride channel protein [Candidatus Acidoferrum sp.]|nr:chloride channel protein [Candidatus Acidoferrum sp.]